MNRDCPLSSLHQQDWADRHPSGKAGGVLSTRFPLRQPQDKYCRRRRAVRRHWRSCSHSRQGRLRHWPVLPPRPCVLPGSDHSLPAGRQGAPVCSRTVECAWIPAQHCGHRPWRMWAWRTSLAAPFKTTWTTARWFRCCHRSACLACPCSQSMHLAVCCRRAFGCSPTSSQLRCASS